MTGNLHSALIVAIAAVITFGLRAAPFVLFPEGKKVPNFINRLSELLPCAVMGMLVVYCLKSVDVTAFPFGLPELIASAVVVVSYVWKRSTILSILSGTVLYVILIQFVFV